MSLCLCFVTSEREYFCSIKFSQTMDNISRNQLNMNTIMQLYRHVIPQGRRQDHAWVGASARGVSISGSQGYSPLGNFEKLSCLSPHFLHSESHLNPHSLIKCAFVARGWVQTHPLHPPSLPTALCHEGNFKLYF